VVNVCTEVRAEEVTKLLMARLAGDERVRDSGDQPTS
jgi:hypothetical protein